MAKKVETKITTIAAVQVRLMGQDAAAVKAAAQQLSAAGFASTGEAPMRGGDGLRVYGSMHVEVASSLAPKSKA